MTAPLQQQQYASLYVGDLRPEVTEGQLYEIFQAAGLVATIRICRNNLTRRSLGYAYVNYYSEADASRAIETLSFSNIRGRSCRVMWSQRDSTQRRSGEGNIVITNLDPNIDNKALFDTFGLFGKILSCKVSTDPYGKSNGCGFVQFETEEAARHAIENTNGMMIGEKIAKTCKWIKKSERPVKNVCVFTNVYVKCFPIDWDEAKLKEEFGKYGNITSFLLRQDARGRFFAFLNFENPESASMCVTEMHLKEVGPPEVLESGATDAEGHPLGKLYVGRALNKTERRRFLRDKLGGLVGEGAGVNLYIKNLPEGTSDESFREMFSHFGTITSTYLAKTDDGINLGYGFVCFSRPEEATNAVTEMHLKAIGGNPLYVGLAEKKEVRQERLRQRFEGGRLFVPDGGKGKNRGKVGKGGKSKFDGKSSKGKGKYDQARQYDQAPMYPGHQMGNVMAPGMMGGGMMNPAAMMAPNMMNPMVGRGPVMNACMQQSQMQMQQQMAAQQHMMMMMQAGMGQSGKGGIPQGCFAGAQGKGGMAGMMGGCMPGSMPLRPQLPQQSPQHQQQPQGQGTHGMGRATPVGPGAGISATMLAQSSPAVQKQLLGEKLYTVIHGYHPDKAGKITGMMLEMSAAEISGLLENHVQLHAKVDEAVRILNAAEAPGQAETGQMLTPVLER